MDGIIVGNGSVVKYGLFGSWLDKLFFSGLFHTEASECSLSGSFHIRSKVSKKVGETPSDRILRTVTLLWETPFYISRAKISRIEKHTLYINTHVVHIEDVDNEAINISAWRRVGT